VYSSFGGGMKVNDILIYWHHVGREHGGLTYAPTIQKNSLKVVNNTLKLKEDRIRQQDRPCQFIKYDSNTLVELPPENSDSNFIIVYFIDQGLQFELNDRFSTYRWMIDIVDIEEMKPNVFCVHDYFIDIAVHDDSSYQVLDLDEFTIAFESDVMTKEQVTKSLTSFDVIIEELNRGEFPNQRLSNVVQRYMTEREISG
jgi:predicted RNA-binding protein associated with RNAse of E/G family